MNYKTTMRSLIIILLAVLTIFLTFIYFGYDNNYPIERSTIEKTDNIDHLKLGMKYHWDWKLPEAIEEYTKAINKDEDNGEAYFVRGFAKYDLGDEEGAENDWIQARILGASETPEHGYFMRGVRRYDSGDKEGGCEDWYIAEKLGETLATTFIKNYCN